MLVLIVITSIIVLFSGKKF